VATSAAGHQLGLPRRRFITGAAATVAVAACASGDDGGSVAVTTAPDASIPVPDLDADPFTLGVASGDPLDDAVVIWTRLAVDPTTGDGGMPARPVPVRWEVAGDEAFSEPVADGVATAAPDLGHSVHVDVSGLEPDGRYHYRFTVGEFTSPVGRARTLPAVDAEVDRLRFAVANCQAYQSGYFTPYEHLAEEDLDLVFFVGDYIYELENTVEVRPHGLAPMRTLDDYRTIYTINHADELLRAAHAAHTWVMTWDDHEVEDNYAGLEPGRIGLGLDPDARAGFPEKRAAAYQAWWENLPVRPGPPADGELDIHRAVAFGDLATFAVVDDRQHRDPIAAGAGDGALPRPFGGGPQVPEAFAEDRSILGFEQEAWLLELLASSATPWNVLVQQSIVAEVDRRPDLDDAGYTLDAWDGYVASRNRILGLVAEEPVPGFVSVGGDIHTGAVADLRADYKDPDSPVVGAELVAPSISATEVIEPEALAGSRANPHIHYYEPDRRGYLLCTVTPEGFEATFRYVTTTAQGRAEVEDGPSWTVGSDSPAATRT
jgi:alkaline phosphatase D